ncbi:MAG TPA: BolA family transcriptional regulator [Polyangiaceae bacterium]|nr:BolA family transcriptional regulator [Polyangiaceae bacterium]
MADIDSPRALRQKCAVIEPERLEQLIRAALPDAQIQLEDLTGTQDHYQAVIVSEVFSGLAPLARHRLVYNVLAEELRGPIHALTLKTYTPQGWAELGND